jgi:hypothetical protein
MRTRLTERDLSRIVRRVISENTKVEMSNPCIEKLKKLRSDSTYKKILKKIEEYNSLEWWEWYDKLNLLLTIEETKLYVEFLKKEKEILMGCDKKKIN